MSTQLGILPVQFASDILRQLISVTPVAGRSTFSALTACQLVPTGEGYLNCVNCPRGLHKPLVSWYALTTNCLEREVISRLWSEPRWDCLTMAEKLEVGSVSAGSRMVYNDIGLTC